jgi:hypothetical protein
MRILITLAIASLTCFAADTGQLKFEVNPGRAGVFIDGKYVGPAANFKIGRTYDIPAGEHEVRLVEPRYEEIVRKVTVIAGKKTVIKETMTARPTPQPPFGNLRIQFPADHFAAVYVNGQFMGHVGEFDNVKQGLLLNPGTYEVKVVPVNGSASPLTKTVTIEANKTSIVKP